MRAQAVRTLRLADDAYVVTCGGGDGAVDGGVVAGLARTADHRALFVIVDVVDARRLGAGCVELVLATARALRSAGGDLWLVAADPRLLRDLEVDGAGRFVQLEPTLAGAVEAVTERRLALH